MPIVAVSGAVVTCNKARMSLWLLTYNNRHGRLHGVFIIEAASLFSARMGAADSALDEGASFAEGQELDAAPVGANSARLCRHDAFAQRGDPASRQNWWQRAVELRG